jgi:hypothetical protein
MSMIPQLKKKLDPNHARADRLHLHPGDLQHGDRDSGDAHNAPIANVEEDDSPLSARTISAFYPPN